jgi:DNA-binding NarL/FixJ family response regulator
MWFLKAVGEELATDGFRNNSLLVWPVALAVPLSIACGEIGAQLNFSLKLPARRKGKADPMKENARLCPRQRQIVELLLQGCDNAEIARQLNMARRTVKAHFNRLFLRFGITGGIKRVKLATLLYRRQACQQADSMAIVTPMNENTESSNSLPRG